MQIILLEKIANVGDLGDVVKVRQGYARNYLIPQGKAKRATPENLKAIEDKRSELEQAATERLAAARALAERLEGMAIQVTQKAGVDGRLFGSVTNIDIVDALKSQGVEIERSMIRMSAGPLKQVGNYPLTVALHTDVVAHINVSVRGESAVS
ncbi:MAG TPA: 50S ribosomal protein L9 [Casimicrobiaceae bacterium]|nr:50S ribosomal protein L9 [Casimicrobiaceae bacterium]